MVAFKVIAITALATTALADVATFNNYASQGKYVHPPLSPFPNPNSHLKLSYLHLPLARSAAQSQAHQGPTAPRSPTSPPSGRAANATVTSTPRNAAARTLSAATAGPRVPRTPAGSASKCVTRAAMAARRSAEWGIVLPCRLLMHVQVRARIIIARRVCRPMRDVVRVGLMRMYFFHCFPPLVAECRCEADGRSLLLRQCLENVSWMWKYC
jgi:hypothetical protein